MPDYEKPYQSYTPAEEIDILSAPPEELAPFTLLLPQQMTGHYYDTKNVAMHLFKDYIKCLTDGSLPKHTAGHLAASLVLGFMSEVKPRRTGLYSLEGEGRGITFHDPELMYCRWVEVEKGVGNKKQRAIRRLIDNRGNDNLHYKHLKRYARLNSKATS